ncbi:MAG: CxxxxCH/CxxCH domain-containing protein [Desulfuromonadaceae bacterium]|nr:CxxxxCH/CxxCH domain-containing protein [Desulfuromonadaceae bacterium]
MNISHTQTTSIRVLVALTLTLISLAGLPGKAEAATCLTCHAPVGSTTDIRPVESTYRNITTGSVKGSHAKHIPAATLDANACASCHGTAASGYLTNHRNGFITVTSAGGIGYSKATSFPQSGSKTLVLGSCSAASCHANPYGAGSVTSPVWGTAAANCTACHTTPIGATGPATGSHTTTTAHAVVCTTCHAAGTTATSTPSTGHNNGTIDVANVGYPLAKAKGSAATTCSNASCHLNVYGAGSVTTPVWGTSASCTACHTIAIDATGPNTGSHAKHAVEDCTKCHEAGTTQITKPSTGHADGNVTVTNAYPVTAKHAAGSYAGTCTTTCHSATTAPGTSPVWGTPGDCATCHASVPTTGTHTQHLTLPFGNPNGRNYTTNLFVCGDCHSGAVQNSNAGTGHLNNNIDVTNGYPATVAKHAEGSGYASCATSYCHSSGQSLTNGNDATPVYQTTAPAWGGAATYCGACHPAGGMITSGSHSKHIASDIRCYNCHVDAALGTYYSSTHINKQIDVDAGLKYELAPGVSAAGAPGNGYGTCSTASCHDNGKGVSVVSATWGSTAPACTACHALVPGDSHTKHVSTTTYKKALCADCHTGYVQGTTAAANHLNATVEVNAGSYPSPKAKGSAVGTCTTSYCHSSGQSADGLSATPVYASVTWGGTAACGSCHATTTLATGTHAKHLASDNNCDYCHSQAYVTSYNSTNHVNGQIEVTSMGYTAGGAPGNGYGTCSTAVCHGSIAPPAWGVNTTNDTCTKCHGTGTVTVTSANKYVIAPTDAAATDKGIVSSLPKVGAHQTHLQLLNGLSQQGDNAEARCVTCHGALPTTGSHVAGMFGGGTPDPTTTFNGLATTSAGGTMVPSYSAGSCSNTYCHNPAGTNGTLDPLNAGTGTSPSWTNAGYLGDTLKSDTNCNACHKSPGNPAFTLASHNSTQMPQGIATDCSSCHGHNGGVGGAVGKQHMDGIRYASGACDACHGYPPMSSAKLAARSGADFASARLEDYAGGGGYHSSHLLTTVTVADGFTPCLPCHPSTVHMQGGSTITQANVNVNYDAADTNLRFDGTRSKRYNNTDVKWTCSNISCHFKPSPAWNL